MYAIGEIGWDQSVEQWPRYGLDLVSSYQDYMEGLLNFPINFCLKDVFGPNRKPMTVLADMWKQYESIMHKPDIMGKRPKTPCAQYAVRRLALAFSIHNSSQRLELH